MSAPDTKVKRLWRRFWDLLWTADALLQVLAYTAFLLWMPVPTTPFDHRHGKRRE